MRRRESIEFLQGLRERKKVEFADVTTGDKLLGLSPDSLEALIHYPGEIDGFVDRMLLEAHYSVNYWIRVSTFPEEAVLYMYGSGEQWDNVVSAENRLSSTHKDFLKRLETSELPSTIYWIARNGFQREDLDFSLGLFLGAGTVKGMDGRRQRRASYVKLFEDLCRAIDDPKEYMEGLNRDQKWNLNMIANDSSDEAFGNVARKVVPDSFESYNIFREIYGEQFEQVLDVDRETLDFRVLRDYSPHLEIIKDYSTARSRGHYLKAFADLVWEVADNSPDLASTYAKVYARIFRDMSEDGFRLRELKDSLKENSRTGRLSSPDLDSVFQAYEFASQAEMTGAFCDGFADALRENSVGHWSRAIIDHFREGTTGGGNYRILSGGEVA